MDIKSLIIMIEELFEAETEAWKIIQLGKILKYLKGE